MKGLFRQTPDFVPASPSERCAAPRAPAYAHVLIDAERSAVDGLAIELAGLVAMRRLVTITGPYAFAADLAAPTTSSLDAALDAIGRMRGVRRTQTGIVLSQILSR